MTDHDRQVVSHYEDRLAEHGPGPAALDWGSRESQERRFEVLYDAIDSGLKPGPVKVLDVGCGFGDFYRWLASRHHGVLEYAGVDLTEAMLKVARARHVGIRFVQGAVFDLSAVVCDQLDGDFGYQYPAVVASGLFGEAPSKVWALEAIEHLWSVTGQVLAFNVQTSGPRDAGQIYFDPTWLASLPERMAGCKLWQLRHDYLPHDATLVLHRSLDA